MEAKPRTDEFTVQEAARILEVGERWLFKWLRDNGHLNNQRAPKGIAAANRYLRLEFGRHTRHGVGQRQHWRPIVTQPGMEWLVEEVAKAKLEEQAQQEKEAS